MPQFSANFAWDCFVASAPRNDIVNIFIAIASPDARDKLHEAISGIRSGAIDDRGYRYRNHRNDDNAHQAI